MAPTRGRRRTYANGGAGARSEARLTERALRAAERLDPIVPYGLRGPSTRISSPIGGRSCESRTPMARLTADPRTLAAMATIPTSTPIPLAPVGAPAGGSYWFTTGDPGPARPAARGPRHGGRRHRRRRVHRAVGGDPPARDRPVAAGRRARGGPGRRRRERPERRLLRGVADPRPGQRAAPLPRRDRRARGGGPPQPRRAGRVRPRRGHRLRPRADGGARRRDRGVAGARARRSGSSCRLATARSSSTSDRDAVQAEVHSPRFLAGRPGGRRHAP